MGSKCEEVGIRGYPSIKHGDPNDLQDYKGGRDFAALKKFASELGPSCGPANLDLCTPEKKKDIEEFQKMGSAKREEISRKRRNKSKRWNRNLRHSLRACKNPIRTKVAKKTKPLKI